MQYKLLKSSVDFPSSGVLRKDSNGEISCIPESERNRDWQEYQDWLSQGNTPIPADSDWLS